MSRSTEKDSASDSSNSSQTEMAQAFRDVARGEQQAAAMEASLTKLESKLDALLASIENGDGAGAGASGTGQGAAAGDAKAEPKPGKN
ncbi:hypothetical protein GGR56DRAFT_186342 [Xylariaceae sp. FL0804]|nr:hypothetical protein GGR56DRAFT_186342 [Xylariaceae sp. FL0804]